MSLLPNSTNANPTTTFYSPVTSGKFAVSAGTVTQTIPIPGMTSAGLVIPVYIHPSGGGAAQFINNVVPGTNQVVVTLGANAGAGEFIIWHALKFF